MSSLLWTWKALHHEDCVSVCAALCHHDPGCSCWWVSCKGDNTCLLWQVSQWLCCVFFVHSSSCSSSQKQPNRSGLILSEVHLKKTWTMHSLSTTLFFFPQPKVTWSRGPQLLVLGWTVATSSTFPGGWRGPELRSVCLLFHSLIIWWVASSPCSSVC